MRRQRPYNQVSYAEKTVSKDIKKSEKLDSEAPPVSRAGLCDVSKTDNKQLATHELWATKDAEDILEY